MNESYFHSTAQNVLKYLRSDNSADANKMAETLSVTKRTIERAIKELRDKEYIRRTGSDKSGHYKIFRRN